MAHDAYHLPEACSTIHDQSLASKQSLFYLDANTERYLLGLLLETAASGWVLGVTKYVGAGHKGLLNVIEEHIGLAVQLHWGGEMLISNAHAMPAFGALHRVNETSGLLHGNERIPCQANRAQTVVRVLRDLSPMTVSSDVDIHPFSEDRMYLHPLLSNVGSDFRHNLENIASALRLLVRTNCTDQNMATLHDVLYQHHEELQLLKLGCALIAHEEPQLHSAGRQFCDMIDAFLEDRWLTRDDADRLEAGASFLLSVFAEGVGIGNEFDLYCLGAG